jgi:hypothetical protein
MSSDETPPRFVPAVDRAKVERKLRDAQRILDGAFSTTEQRVEALFETAAAALDATFCRAYFDPNDSRIVDDLAVCAWATSGVLRAVGANAAVRVPFIGPRGQTFEVVSDGFQPLFMSPMFWRSGLFASVIAREHEAMSVFLAFPTDLLRESGKHAGEWAIFEAIALQAMLRWPEDVDPLLGEKVTDAMREADPALVDPAASEWVLDVVFQEIHLGYEALKGKMEAFDTVMSSALESHRHFYGPRGAGRGRVDGSLAFAPLAMACAARRLRRKVGVDSALVPRWLVDYRTA